MAGGLILRKHMEMLKVKIETGDRDTEAQLSKLPLKVLLMMSNCDGNGKDCMAMESGDTGFAFKPRPRLLLASLEEALLNITARRFNRGHLLLRIGFYSIKCR